MTLLPRSPLCARGPRTPFPPNFARDAHIHSHVSSAASMIAFGRQEMGMATTDFRYEVTSNKVVLIFAGAEAIEKAAALQDKVRRRVASVWIRIPRRPCAGSSGSTPVRAIQLRDR